MEVINPLLTEEGYEVSAIKIGDKVTRAGFDGVVIGEYLPGMFEVRLGRGVVVVPDYELEFSTGYEV